MILNKLKPRKSLNKAFLKVKPSRSEIEVFKTNLIQLIDQINDTESEEFHKNLVSDFLKKTYYDPNHSINTKGRNDLVIHNGKDAKTPVGVIIEAKKPTNKAEMLSTDKLNTKAFQELVLYYLRERITQKNLEIKYLIGTNINEWFVFDANVFEKNFAQNKKLIKQFEDFEDGRLAGKTTEFFYKEIAEPFINQLDSSIEFTHFDLKEYDRPLRNNDKKDDNKLIALFKLLSPEHLLKLPFANDSNSLDKKFYSELLHIIGLTETKQGGKKVIERNKAGERNSGSLLENAVIQLDTLDKIHRLEKPSLYGAKQEERLFNVGLELSITWVNRILFLKLLEAQLITYHKDDPSYSFLNFDKIKNYDDLNSLFFQVLAKKHHERNEDIKKEFAKVPYLNSSLFEPNEMEHSTIFISNLQDEKKLPILSSTVLKDKNGKKRTGELNALQYFFEFLEAYDFSSEGAEDIQEDNKTLINASVLGLIFEKINGYKDGSFFTPGFITMYMCREIIRRSVAQKFNDTKGWNCKDLDDLYDKIEDRQEANDIVNSLKICDPAVGSGHFLVSALNEIIAIKNDLKILQDRDGRRLKEYHFEVVNDELVVTDDDGELFEYRVNNKESQRLQETLFYEKQAIIENCLFGVDINPNSVKICRLRLWIELLKNAYYKNETELETLPNIDINIKCGNSLISRFDLNSDIKEALKKSKWTIDSYRLAVDSYRNAQSKEEKHEMERLINDIKSDFRSEISRNDPKLKRLYKLNGELANLTTQTSIFEMSAKEKKDWNKKMEKLTKGAKKLETEIEEIKNNKIYENAFEWRFEFPEVLNNEGDFVGFDTVIGNPPYIRVQNLDSKEVDFYFKNFKTPSGKLDISILFFEKALNIQSHNGLCSYISSSQWTQTDYGKEIRNLLSQKKLHKLIDFGSLPVFEEADTYPAIFIFGNSNKTKLEFANINQKDELTYEFLSSMTFNTKEYDQLNSESWNFSPFDLLSHLNSLNIPYKRLDQIGSSYIGLLTGMDKAFVIKNEEAESLNLEMELLVPYAYRGDEISPFSKVYPKSKVIYPYQIDNQGNETLINEKDLKNNFPNIYNHLFSHKQKLTKRKDSRKFYATGPNWFRHLRRGGYNLITPKKLIVKGVTTRMAVGLLDEKSSFNGANCPAIILQDTYYNEMYFLGLLNSRLISFFMNSICPKKLGGYFRYNAKSIAKIPIMNPSKDLNTIISNKVIQILDIKKANPEADTLTLETEIDLLVYDLYSLTDEQIEIVERSII
ncbi:Eco57I restriction-modification methylase domain-containing protein [Fulvivirgaceae bacterium BMA12]|uniref:site-specific DNA-methyltransferase (adenine-specific) n=1 Tax=Agaribacillus aureus TaxID=3051825 RepID=A0ABT8LBF6_9BACT|nr:Eco57I restriction-modification methylase domain-containing protein [Fulvivirgaceae bacterium BMA12]